MMRALTIALTMGAALSLAACANDTMLGLGETSALPSKPAVDPACTTLAAKIDGLRKEGVVDRVEAAAKGKGTTVNVKRASLSQIADLEKTNADFQAKCSTVPRSASIAPATQKAAAPPTPNTVAAASKSQVGAVTAPTTLESSNP